MKNEIFYQFEEETGMIIKYNPIDDQTPNVDRITVKQMFEELSKITPIFLN